LSTMDLITVDAPRRDPIRLSPDAAQAMFDELQPCAAPALSGRWVGREVHTGHPLDGALANVSWYGKQFDGPDRVHPLVVADAAGNPFPLNPAVVPMLLISHPVRTPGFVKWVVPTLMPTAMSLLRSAVSARGYGARLQVVTHRGVATAAMSYNDRPVVDFFRAVDEDIVLGSMEYPGMPRPHFFVLQRDNRGDTSVR